jgi:hypothetical protein
MKSELVYALCWRQAAACARARPDSEYVEGAARIPGRTAVARAWCRDRDGTIHEPTWPGRVPAEYLGVAVLPRSGSRRRTNTQSVRPLTCR